MSQEALDPPKSTKVKILTVSARPVSPVLFHSVSGEGSSFSITVPPPTESAATIPLPRVLLVSSKVKSPSVVLSAAREDVLTHLVTYDTASLDSISTQVCLALTNFFIFLSVIYCIFAVCSVECS